MALGWTPGRAETPAEAGGGHLELSPPESCSSAADALD